MLVFVVPLKSAQVSVSWERVSALARRALRSACAQTVADFRVVVVCHEVPAVGFEDPRLEFLPADFPPPGQNVGDRRRDKRRKMLHGLRHARRFEPCHAMILDADDCVSNRLAAHVGRHPSANGWYLRRGYFHREGMTTVHVERWRFHQWCNSSHVVRLALLKVPDGPVEDWDLRHTTFAARMRAQGTPLAPLPFPGAVYNVAHGENFQDYTPILWPRDPFRRALRALVFQRRLTPAIRAEFGLYPVETITR